MKNKKRMGVLLCLVLMVLSACGLAEKSKDSGTNEDIMPIEDNGALKDTAISEDDGASDEMIFHENGELTENGTAGKDDVGTEGILEDESGAAGENAAYNREDAGTDMKLSILGDSISTFEGWIPEGNSVFYPQNGAVQDVSQTWWKMALDETDLILCANGSSSGSTCYGDSQAVDVMVGCSDHRISQLTGADGKEPDVIIVYMGTNDLVMSVPIGDNDGIRPVNEGFVDNFSDAYTLILDKLERKYPDAQIYCCTLLPVGDWGTDQPFVTFVNGENLTSEDYSDRIQTIAGNRGIPVIDLYHCGINIDNMPEMTSDGVHPTPEGMRRIADTVLSLVRNLSGENVMEVLG